MHGNMKAALMELGVYSMEPGTLAEGEAAAYEAAIAWVDNGLTQLLEELFPCTAKSYGLSLWEKALGLDGIGKSIAQRRAAVLEQESQLPGCFSGDLFQRQLLQASENARLVAKNNTLTVAGINRADFNELAALAKVILAHLSPMSEIALEGMGRSWQACDSLSHSWNFYDRAGLPWGFYDTI